MQITKALLVLAALFVGISASAQPHEPSDKRIAITFDDTPRHPGTFYTEDERTRLLIMELEKAGIEQAVFFVNPGKIPEREGAVARMEAYVAAGHVLANHTANHPSLSQTDTAEYIADLDAAASWLEGREGKRQWFRFPYLDEGRADKDKRDALREALAARGLLNASPTVDASDWWLDGALSRVEREGLAYSPPALRDLFVRVHVEAAEFYHALAVETFGRPIAHNILLHETDLSALFIGDLITGLRKAGWTIVTADEAFADPAYLITPDVPSAQGTLTELAAWHQGIAAQRWYPGNDTRLLEQQFNALVLGKQSEDSAVEIPERFLGTWDVIESDCSERSDALLRVNKEQLFFQESLARVTGVREDSGGIILTATSQGEGESFKSSYHLDIVNGHLFIGVAGTNYARLERKRCP